MTIQENAVLNIPFDGFYHSITDSFIDKEIEYYMDENGCEYPDYTVDFLAIAKEYAARYNEWLNYEHGLTLESLEFSALESPKFYNYGTDKVFITLSLEDQSKLFEWWKESHTQEELQKMIDDRFKSCSGFHSFYDAFCEEWKEKPFSEWDENEKSVLFPIPDYYDLWENARGNGFFTDVITFKDLNQ